MILERADDSHPSLLICGFTGSRLFLKLFDESLLIFYVFFDCFAFLALMIGAHSLAKVTQFVVFSFAFVSGHFSK